MNTTTDLPIPRRALAIGAHPDDIEFGCGGTLAKWARAGSEVTHLVLTDGSRGSWDPSEDRSALVDRRQAEQRNAARLLGTGGDVIFLNASDGELQPSEDLRDELAMVIRRFRPDVVLGHDPWKHYRLHPDHRHAGELVVEAIVAAREPHFRPNSAQPPHRPTTLLLFEPELIDHLESIDAFFATKIAALRAHTSQLVSTMRVAPDELDDLDRSASFRDFVEQLRTRHEQFGVEHSIELAEAFKRIDET